jgi:hypothetical protein
MISARENLWLLILSSKETDWISVQMTWSHTIMLYEAFEFELI